jgi:uncharacterized protein YgbK (DUF1537 family)
MVIKTVIALLLFSQGALIEHTITDNVSHCLKMKREMMRNMSDQVQIMCGEVEAEIEVMQGREFIKKIRKTTSK